MALISQSLATFTGKTLHSCLFWSSSSNGVIGGITLKSSIAAQLGVRSKGTIVTAILKPGEPSWHANQEAQMELKRIGVDELPKKKLLNGKKLAPKEFRKAKQSADDAEESSSESPEPDVESMREILQMEVDREYDKAVKALGLESKVLKVRKEFSDAKSLDQRLALMETLDKVLEEINEGLPAAPNYQALKNMNDMLKQLDKAQQVKFEKSLKEALETKCKMVLARPELRQEYEVLLTEIINSEAPSPADFNEPLKARIAEWKKAIELALVEVLKTTEVLSIEVIEAKAKVLTDVILYPNFSHCIDGVVEEVTKAIYRTQESSPELKSKIRLRELEINKYKMTPDDLECQRRIEELERQIAEEMEEAMYSSRKY